MNRKVSLVWYCKTDKGWKRLPAVIGGNNRVRPGYAMENDEERKYPQGQYQLRFYEGSKVKYESAGKKAAEALSKMRQKQLALDAQGAARSAGAVIVEEPSRMNLQRQLDRFLEVVRDRGSNVAADVYKLAADEFLIVTGKRYADELTADDLRDYQRALRNRGLADRTLFNRYANLKAFLLYCGLKVKTLSPSAPTFEKTLPEMYTAEQLTEFFGYLTDDYHRLVFTLLLKCGLREQEAMYLCWLDISFSSGMLLVRGKDDLGFKVKDKEQRELPIPSDLVEMLKDWKAKHPNSRLVIGTKTDKPNTKLLRTLKRLVKAAGMNCGGCEGCKEHGECGGWYLHKFRSTYCTKLLRANVDVRTVQNLMGHSDLQTTMKYLRPHGADAIRDRVGAINWGAD